MSTIKDEENLSILSEERLVDPLLSSLSFLAKYFQRTTSKATLISGFALDNKLMTIKDFVESSKRLGLISKVVNRPIKDISRFALPSVLILQDKGACILLDFNVEMNLAKVILPNISDGETTITIEELTQMYTGKIIIIKPTYDFSNRISDDIVIEEPRKWFFGAMKRNMFIYQKVIIAAILINLFVLATPLFMKNVFDRVLPNNFRSCRKKSRRYNVK